MSPILRLERIRQLANVETGERVRRQGASLLLPAGQLASFPVGLLTMASPDKKAFLLRLDPALWAELERLAAIELRSVNGQIEYLLRHALSERLGKDLQPSTTTNKRKPR